MNDTGNDSARFDLRTPEERHYAEMGEMRERVRALEIAVTRLADELEYARQLIDRLMVSPK